MKAHVLSLVVAMLFSAISTKAFSLANPEVWINELHYDNSGADVGEFVEVAGAAGTDLSNYFIYFYNGDPFFDMDAMTLSVSYDSRLNLSGTIDDEQNGFGAVSFLRSGIQNDRDGLALFRKGPGDVGTTATLLQFLSYEGAFVAESHPVTSTTAANRPFNTVEILGKLSTDIGVSESNAALLSGGTPVGHSLQLTGVGLGYGDFTWSGPAAASPGSLNSGQRIPVPAPDGGATLLLLGMGTLGVVTARRWFVRP